MSSDDRVGGGLNLSSDTTWAVPGRRCQSSRRGPAGRMRLANCGVDVATDRGAEWPKLGWSGQPRLLRNKPRSCSISKSMLMPEVGRELVALAKIVGPEALADSDPAWVAASLTSHQVPNSIGSC